MPKPAYPAARTVAVPVADRLEAHHATARSHGAADLAPTPGRDVVEAVVNTAFWASLRREEGRSPTISLAYLPPEQAPSPLLLDRPLPLDAAALVRLSPAVERPGIHLGVWRGADGLHVWGATRAVPPLCFVVEVLQPGIVVVKHSRAGGFGKYANVAVLIGDQVKVVDEKSARFPDCPPLVTRLLGAEPDPADDAHAGVLLQLAVSMRAHGRGGGLLVVPDGGEGWRESILRPVAYDISPAYTGLADVLRRREEREEDAGVGERRRAELRQAVDAVAGLTAVDGATVISDAYEVLAFGAKIGRPAGSEAVERVVVTEPVVGLGPAVVHPARLGGTRHLSAAQFAHDQRDAYALVASQDGRFTVFAWSPAEEMVHAHRVETLLV